jgi:UDP-N-acetylglucosamine--N-acetylmuramyl-(pentapeptide) pyrophosphoryl-undecaprenol N-acetylglucosamine transferase
MTAVTVVLAAGGTGGHVFPGLALAEALVRAADVTPMFVGTARGFETKLVPHAGYPLELFDVVPIKGGGASQAFRGGASAARALGEARRFLRAARPSAVVSVGGYASGPVSLAASTLGIPLAIVEPNSVMGLANRWLAPLARRIYLAFAEARPALVGARARVSGVPLRDGFSPRPTVEASKKRVLVLGGSQGAKALNALVPEALGLVAREAVALEVRHQAGEAKDQEALAAYARLGLLGVVTVVPFSDSLAADIAWADLVIARAGAGTLAEIAAVGRASLLVPLPNAADDHQAKNAAAFASTGAAEWIRQDDADPSLLAAAIHGLLTDDARREALAAASVARGRPEAARTIARDLLEMAGVH